jgi:uncharacterized protein GlcG (DUF336 family)
MAFGLAEAQAVIGAAHDHAIRTGLRVAVAVVDEGGVLVALGRMDGAPYLAPQLAEAKAMGAVLWLRSGEARGRGPRQRPAFSADLRERGRAPAQFGGLLFKTPLIGATGSLLIRRGETVVGAIGVSGASPEQESDCAAAGLATLTV